MLGFICICSASTLIVLSLIRIQQDSNKGISISAFFVSLIFLFSITNPNKFTMCKRRKIKFVLEYFVIEILTFIFGPLLFFYFLSCPIDFKVFKRSFPIFLFRFGHYSDYSWKICVTVIFSLVLLNLLSRIYFISVRHRDISILGRYWRNNIVNAFFKKEKDYKLNSLQYSCLPIIISNLTLNDLVLENDDFDKQEDITSDIFMVTPYSAGSRLTGFFEVDEWETLDVSISTSAAAISYSMGDYGFKHDFFRIILHLFSLNLGSWVRFKSFEQSPMFYFINTSHLSFFACMIAFV